jgi:pro-apoptotic serine protease NMA111
MSLRDIHRIQHKIVEFDRRLCLTELAERNFDTGLWTKIDLPKFPDTRQPLPRKAQLFKSSHPKHEKASYIINSLVWVQTWVPVPVDGFEVSRKQNYGLVFNSELGLVLASRDAVPHYFCRCTVMILNSIIIPCEPVFMHPVQNFVVLRYDPSLIQNTFPSARLSMVDVQPGDTFLFFRGNDVGDLELSPTVVAGISSSAIAADIKTGERSLNMDILEVDTNMTAWTSGSGLITEEGEVQALYMGGYCVNTSTIVPTLKEIERGETPEIRLLGAHMRRIEMGDARAMGVTQGKYNLQASISHATDSAEQSGSTASKAPAVTKCKRCPNYTPATRLVSNRAM